MKEAIEIKTKWESQLALCEELLLRMKDGDLRNINSVKATLEGKKMAFIEMLETVGETLDFVSQTNKTLRDE